MQSSMKESPRAVAVVQARMGSTRMPGKVLTDLAGRPVLWHVLRRLARSRNLDAIVVATSDLAEDDVLASFAERQGALVVRGPADNVLERFRLAVELTDPGTIVRITGDAPLVDPQSIDRWLEALAQSGADTVSVEPAGGTIHEGIDLLSRAALERLFAEAADDPVAREHVTGWYKLRPDKLTAVACEADPRHLATGVRTSVDTPDDLAFLEAVHYALGAGPGEIDLAELVALLAERPDLVALNAHVHQKAPDEPTRRALLWIDTAQDGELLRERALFARELRDRFGMGVVLASDRTSGVLESSACPFEVCPSGSDEIAWMADLVARHTPDWIVVESLDALASDLLQAWRSAGHRIALMPGGDAQGVEPLVALPAEPQAAAQALAAA